MLLPCFQDNPHCPVTAAKASIKSASCFCYTPQGDNHFTDFRSHILEDIRLQVTKMGSKLQSIERILLSVAPSGFSNDIFAFARTFFT